MVASVLRANIKAYAFGLTMEVNKVIKCSSAARSGQPLTQIESQEGAIVIVDHIMNTHHTTIHQAIAYEIHTPVFIGREWLHQWRFHLRVDVSASCGAQLAHSSHRAARSSCDSIRGFCEALWPSCLDRAGFSSAYARISSSAG